MTTDAKTDAELIAELRALVDADDIAQWVLWGRDCQGGTTGKLRRQGVPALLRALDSDDFAYGYAADYARQTERVEELTKQLAAKDAEIVALRDETARLREALSVARQTTNDSTLFEEWGELLK